MNHRFLELFLFFNPLKKSFGNFVVLQRWRRVNNLLLVLRWHLARHYLFWLRNREYNVQGHWLATSWPLEINCLYFEINKLNQLPVRWRWWVDWGAHMRHQIEGNVGEFLGQGIVKWCNPFLIHNVEASLMVIEHEANHHIVLCSLKK